MKKKAAGENRKNKSPILLILLLILLVAIAGIAFHLVSRYLPTNEKMAASEYFGEKAEDEVYITIGSTQMESRGKVYGELVYVPLDLVSTYLNQRFYWDAQNAKVLYATPSELTSFVAFQEPGQEVWTVDGVVYLSLPYILSYTDLETVYEEDPAHLAIQNEFTEITVVTAKRNAAVRSLGGIKAPVLTKVDSGEDLRVIEEFDTWYQVLTPNGYVGFVQKSHVSAAGTKTYEREFTAEEYTYLTLNEKVNLVWHQVTIQEANSYLAESIANMTGVNVISPTWYSIADNNGNITDISSAEYVAAAHERGIQVWGLVDNFSTSISTYETLSNSIARQNLINQLVASAVNVGMDGINIDFETLSEDTGVHFLEFLREMSIECHKNNLILSVDNPVPEDFTSHYNRSEQGMVVDYVIIMGYDEHYQGSETAGSVASLPWVEEGIIETIAEAPANRVINAIPFYTRIWKTLAGTLSSEAVGMNAAQQFITDNNVETYWNTEVSQYVGAYDAEDGSHYDIWLEDNESIAEKVKLIAKYDLAGVAAWKLGLENDSVWQVITENMQ